MRTTLRKFIDTAMSGKATLILLGALLVTLIIGQAMPWIYTSPFTLALLAAFFVNLASVMISKVPGTINRCRLAEPSEVSPQVQSYTEAPVGDRNTEEVLDKVREALPGYSLIVEGSMFSATRFRYGPLGTLVLYAAVLLLLAGGLIVFYTRTQGEVVLTEGQIFTGAPMEYKKFSPPLIGLPPRLGFAVVSIRHTGPGLDPRGLSAELDVFRPEGAVRETLKGGDPLKIRNGTVSFKEAGVSPRLLLKGHAGMIYEDAYVSLSVFYGEEDGYRFPATPYFAKFKFYPDYYKSKFGDGTRSLEINNPVFRVQIYKSDRLIHDELMKPGDQMYIDDLSFGIGDIRLWGGFIITRQEGMPLVIAGLIIGIAGLVWSLIFFRRLIRGQFRDGKLLISGESDYFPGLNKKRIEKLAERLRH